MIKRCDHTSCNKEAKFMLLYLNGDVQSSANVCGDHFPMDFDVLSHINHVRRIKDD